MFIRSDKKKLNVKFIYERGFLDLEEKVIGLNSWLGDSFGGKGYKLQINIYIKIVFKENYWIMLWSIINERR